MMESFGYGLLLALAFVGFISIAYNVLLHYLRFDSTGKLVVDITDEMSKNDIYNLIYGINTRKTIYGDWIFNEVIIIDSLAESDKKVFLNEICEGLSGFSLVHRNEIDLIFNDKGV